MNWLAAISGLLLLALTPPRPLPPSAKITIGALQSDKSVRYDTSECTGWTLSKHQVREMFRTYHQLKSGELQAGYLFPACWISGTILAAGKTYHWQARPGNTLETNWPDGTTRMFGGEHSDDPSGN